MKKCKINDCDRNYYSKGYCRKHYDRVRNHGSAKKRTRKDPNEIILYDTYAEIVLYYQNKEFARTQVDLLDVEKLKQYKWYLSGGGYAATGVKSSNGRHTYRNVKLHRLLMNFPIAWVDHKDRNKLNNRKENLREANRVLNSRNKGMQSNNTSGVVGVTWNKLHRKWYASIKVNKKDIFLGLFKNIEDAKKKRIEAELNYFKDFRSSVNGELK